MSGGSIHEEDQLDPVLDRAIIARLLGYARPYAWQLFGCVLLLGVATATQLLQPYVIKLAIDAVLAPQAPFRTPDALAPYVFGYLAAVVTEGFIDYGQGVWLRITGQSIIAQVRHDVFAHLQTLELAFFDRHPVGRLVTRATNDVEALNEMYTSVLVNLFRDVFRIVGTALVMLALDWQLALISFIALPAVYLTATTFQRLARASWRVVRVHLAAVNATLAENFSGVRTIQVFAREAQTLNEFEVINQRYFESSFQRLRIYSVFRPLLECIATLSLAALLWYGSFQAIANTITFGTLFLFTTYNRQLFEPINALAEKYNILQSALAAAERLFQLLNTKPAIADKPDTPIPPPRTSREAGPVVAFENVFFRYSADADAAWILEDVSFAVEVGQTVAFVGHTGAGKSTIMSLLTRFYDVQAGTVRVDGVDVRDWPQAALRQRIGAVMQDVFLFADDLRFNVTLGNAQVDADRLAQAAAIVGANEFVATLPLGWDTPMAERGVTISAGQRQLVAFTRTLAHDPGILVLDEATASIDTATEQALQSALRGAGKGRTTLVVAHRLSTIQEADQIVVLHHGKLREQGTHTELLTQQGLYHRLWQLQAARTH